MAISIPANTSGYLEDSISTHTDSVSVGDLLGYRFVASAAGINTFDIDWVGAQFLSTDSSLCMIGGSPENPTFIPFQGTDETTFYSSLFGGGDIRETKGGATGLFP